MYQILISHFSDNLGLNSVLLRSFLAFFTSLGLSLVCGTPLINYLKLKQGKGQPIREDGPQSHLLTKKGTPTMGGLLILGTAISATFLFANPFNIFILVALGVLLIYGFVGFLDDHEKVTKQTANAMSAKMKLLLQFSTSLIAILILTFHTPEAARFNVKIPYFATLAINLWWFYVPFAMVVVTGSSNAVNLNDGLDGLAASLLVLAFGFFMIVAYLAGSALSQEYNLYTIPEAKEVTVLCAALIGSCLGFLWFNANPAKVFMGDTGSLALGALLGTIAVMLKAELLLAITGFVFVAEALSVMIQVVYFKKTGGKRFFKMAPIHHHFEQSGWKETTVVARFWIIAFALTALGLLSLFIKVPL